jgi:predicted DCC family thiol-disulfide oxidoreductase YuxK
MTAYAIVYDPDCGFCRVCVALVLSWDREGRLRPVALGTEEGSTMLAGMPEAEQMASWHLVSPGWWGNGAENATHTHHLERAAPVWSAGAAFSPLFRLLPAGAPWARIAERFPGAANRGYRWVADHRSAFGRLLPAAVKRWADRVISESARDGR